jgi:hypothetical protein
MTKLNIPLGPIQDPPYQAIPHEPPTPGRGNDWTPSSLPGSAR